MYGYNIQHVVESNCSVLEKASSILYEEFTTFYYSNRSRTLPSSSFCFFLLLFSYLELSGSKVLASLASSTSFSSPSPFLNDCSCNTVLLILSSHVYKDNIVKSLFTYIGRCLLFINLNWEVKDFYKHVNNNIKFIVILLKIYFLSSS